MDGFPGNQQGNIGLIFPNALGDQFSLSQISGNRQAGGSGSNIFSTVTLTQSGNLIFAEPGESSVDIGQTTTGQNVQYISQMAGTTMINSPVVVNGNVAIPHQYTFSMNPENNPTLPTATLNANVNIGGYATVAIGSPAAPFEGVSLYGDQLGITASSIGATTSNITINTSNITMTTSNINISATSNTTNVSNYVLTSQTASLNGNNGMAINASNGDINLVAASNVNITSSGSNVNLESYYITNVKGSDVNVVADSGLSLFNTPIVNITAQNGPLGGQVNINSYASYGSVAGFGKVSINAFGSENNPALPVGGLIELNAYSAGFGSYTGATSAIRANAASIGLSAGAIPSIPALAGSLVLFGNNIVSICAGSPAIFPQIPLSLYQYGASGLRLDCGTGARVTSLGIFQAPDVELDIIRANSNAGLGVYCADPFTANVITPQPSIFVPNGGGDLFIRGSNTIFHNSYVQLQDVGSLAFATALASNVTGAITGLSTINGEGVGAFSGASWSLYNQISSLSSITAVSGDISSLNVSSLNGLVFAPWYNVPAAGPVSMANNSINNASYIITSNLYSGQLNGLYEGAGQGSLAINTTSSLTMASQSSITIAAPAISISSLSSINGAPYINTQEWALSEAVTNIDAAGNNVGNVGTVFTNNIQITNDFTMVNDGSVANFGGNAITNVSSINGFPITSIVNDWVSTATTQLDMNNFNIVNTNTMTADTFLASLVYMNMLSTASITCFGAVNLNSNALLTVSSIQPTVSNSISFGNAGLTNVSSINNVPINSIVNSWISTATTQLDMNNFDIVNTDTMTANTFLTSFITANSISTSALTCFGDVNMTQNNIINTNSITGNVIYAPSISGLSSINGAAYPAPASWNGNATTDLSMNGNSINNANSVGVVTLTANNSITSLGAISATSGTITANQFNAPNIEIYNNAITVGGIGSTYINNGGINTPQINLTQFVNTPSITNLVYTNGVKLFSAPNVNQYISPGVTGITYEALTAGTVNIQSSTATGGGDLSVTFLIKDAYNIPGEYRFVNANAVNNMNVQFQTADPYGNFPNWGPNYQLNPGQSVQCKVWYSNYQGRYVISNLAKDNNP